MSSSSSLRLIMLMCCLFLFFTWCVEVAFATSGTSEMWFENLVKNSNNSSGSKVEDADYFHIYYGQTFKVIKNGVDGKSYLLIQNNTKMATRTKYCTGRIKSFVIPLSNYSLETESFPVSFFELLGLLGTLQGITSDTVPSECLMKSYMEGGIQMINKTELDKLKQFTAHFVGNTDEQACNFATFLPFYEDTPLQRAEWIKYVGVYANMETRANQVYDSVKENYLCLTKVAANKTTSFKPIIAWLDYSEHSSLCLFLLRWLQYVVDAGAENIDESMSKNTYNISVSDNLDDLFAILCTVDVVIDETYASDPATYTLSTFLQNIDIEDKSSIGFLANQRLWRYDKRVLNSALDWYNGAVSQPQLVLADLMEAFFPTGNYSTTYLRNLAKAKPVVSIDPQTCSRATSTAMEPFIVACQ
ncbi:hypothetical protein Syun_022480 [Stephania yunnanensis]|uniref:Uncharacterized protein n=1 Tax=Stephania yunnanensis TaxID=152371 RepID=A0AAP0I376_9MAGN